MLKMAMSSAALGLLRALVSRANAPRDRILLTNWRSVDWQSLTFTGERHQIELRIAGPDSAGVAARLIHGIGDHEFAIPGQIVADIAAVGDCVHSGDGSALVRLEALTITE
jgi:hypothetical protein